MPPCRQGLGIEVHVGEPLKSLGDSILEAGRNSELLRLRRERQARQVVERDLDLVELEQSPQHRGHDRARAAQPDATRDRALLPNRERALDLDRLLGAPVGESLEGRLHQAEAAVVAVRLDVADQLAQVREADLVGWPGHDLEAWPLVYDDAGLEVRERETDRAAAVCVRRISEQG